MKNPDFLKYKNFEINQTLDEDIKHVFLKSIWYKHSQI